MNKLIASSLIGISLIGCQSTPTANPPDLNRKEFNYATTQTVALEVNVTAAGSATRKKSAAGNA